ncbi:hypothetical protein LXT21_25690 [Myxococcus sp. K38C18041901]|uniref:hypothetical protein n=1 Tax=Myxococcus guangdongensis TaxID=2906760 RepID=UPI0020A81C7F|nr:hypothetical protein [Myxococcus guangdongensis]MCP3062186.1 hypothetical protein [Myxococcus guangdongensis]
MSRTSSSFKHSALAALTSSLLVMGCESPSVVPTADGQQALHTARIEGSLVVQSGLRGNAVVFLYDVDKRPLPPPQGSGRPVAFTVIPAAQLFGPAIGTNSPGPFTAPFAFSLVGAGRYMLRGFIDVDTCATGVTPCHLPDFNPWYGVTSEPNTGDIGGAAVDLTNGQPLVLEVTKDAEGHPQPLTNVTVSFSQATAQVPVDRPAFQATVVVGGDPTLVAGGPMKVLRLTPQVVEAGPVAQRPKAFLVSYVDANRDGVPDDANRDGVPDVWPRVVVRKLADAQGLLEDNDKDRDSVLDADGTDYPRADGTRDGKPDLVVLAAGLVMDPIIAALTDENGQPRMTPVPLAELQVAVQPIALDASEAAPVRLEGLPKGRYSVVLIQSTGQTWRVPNELAPPLAASIGIPGVESQAFVLEVP